MSAEATEKSPGKGNHAVWSDRIAENQKMEKQAATTEEASGDPAIAGGAAVDSVEAAGMEKAVQHWEIGSMVGAVDWWWTVMDDKYDRLEVRQIGEIWW